MAKNICNCPSPPGGRAVCSADQLALCWVENGQARTECVDVPAGLTRTQLDNFILGRIFGKERDLDAAITQTDDQIIRSGRHTQRKLIVTFSRPDTDTDKQGTPSPSQA